MAALKRLAACQPIFLLLASSDVRKISNLQLYCTTPHRLWRDWSAMETARHRSWWKTMVRISLQLWHTRRQAQIWCSLDLRVWFGSCDYRDRAEKPVGKARCAGQWPLVLRRRPSLAGMITATDGPCCLASQRPCIRVIGVRSSNAISRP